MTVKYFLLSLIFFASSCSGQQNPNSQVQIDTAKLFDPKQEPVDYTSTEMFKNFVLLNQRPYAVSIQGKHFQVKSNDELFDTIQNEKAQVVKSKFYVIVDNSFAFKTIVDIIDKLKKLGIDNYKVINFDSYFKPAEPIEIEQPTIITKTIDTNDSTYFSLTILNDNFEAKLLNKKEILKNSSEVDKFIEDNKSLIDPNKILVVGNSKVSYEKMKPILEILKKYQYYKFQMVTR